MNTNDAYGALLREIKQRVSGERVRVALAANSALVRLYWDVGRSILERQAAEGFCTPVVDGLARDLEAAFPDMRGFSPRNLESMRAFAEAWPDGKFVQQLAARLPWFHHCLLLDRVGDSDVRRWYLDRAVAHGWSRSALAAQIAGKAWARAGRAVEHFESTLPAPDSDVAEQVFKDPYLFDFLRPDDPHRELEGSLPTVEQLEAELSA